MSYKNSVKLFSSNFNLVWKQLAFGCACSVLVVLLSLLLALPTIRLLQAENWFETFNNLFKVVYTTPVEINATFKDIISSLANILSANFDSYWFSYIGFCLCAIILPMFLAGISRYTLCVLINNKISSLASVGYTNTLITNIGKASIYSLIKLLIDLAFSIVIGLLFCLYLILAKGVLLTVLLIVIFLAFAVVLLALKLALTSSFAPIMVEEKIGVIKAFRKGVKINFSNFGRTLSNAIVLILTIIFVNVFLGVFTIGVGLFLTLPATAVILSIFMVINYYTITGRRYYLTDSLIVEPKTTETKNLENKGNKNDGNNSNTNN